MKPDVDLSKENSLATSFSYVYDSTRGEILIEPRFLSSVNIRKQCQNIMDAKISPLSICKTLKSLDKTDIPPSSSKLQIENLLIRKWTMDFYGLEKLNPSLINWNKDDGALFCYAVVEDESDVQHFDIVEPLKRKPKREKKYSVPKFCRKASFDLSTCTVQILGPMETDLVFEENGIRAREDSVVSFNWSVERNVYEVDLDLCPLCPALLKIDSHTVILPDHANTDCLKATEFKDDPDYQKTTVIHISRSTKEKMDGGFLDRAFTFASDGYGIDPPDTLCQVFVEIADDVVEFFYTVKNMLDGINSILNFGKLYISQLGRLN